MKVYHVTSPKKFQRYLKSGVIKAPVRAWCDIYEAVRFSCSTGREIILRLKFPDGAQRCPGHGGNAVVLSEDLKLPETLVRVRPQDTNRVIPTHPDGYADHLSGDWADVPDWAIARINFLEDVNAKYVEMRCPLGDKDCPDEPTMSCRSIKHCYPYLCNGSCGHNEIWVSDEEKEILVKYRKEKYGW